MKLLELMTSSLVRVILDSFGYIYNIVCNILNISTAGVATHSLDYKKSAGGFIHGYRYTGNLVYYTDS